MVILRRLAPIFSSKSRFYARKTVSPTNTKMMQVHQETLRYIDPYASIKIYSDIGLKICSADPHMYPDGDALVAELHGDPVKNCTASMEVKVSDDERSAEVSIRKLTDSTNFHCELAVPIKAALDIEARQAVKIENTYGDKLKVAAQKCINTKNIRSENIELFAYEGDINCQGILLGKHTSIETGSMGNINLDKLQGDYITCKTIHGHITTGSCYVDSSKFETETGCLDLKNVHKETAVTIKQKGDLKMSGVHGNFKITSNGGSMNLQLSELHGQNTIEAKNLTNFIINISDNIEKNASIDICLTGGEENPSAITLDSKLNNISSALTEDKKQLKWLLNKKKANNLKVVSNTSLILGKSSWMESMRSQMAEFADGKS